MTLDLQPFWEAETAVQIHVVAALFALVTGLVIFTKQKGTRLHKFIGRSWMGAMAITALSSFMIHELKTWGLFSPIHLLSIWTIGVLFFAVWVVRKGNIYAHKFSLIGLYIGGLVVAGLLTLSRGLMHQIFIGKGNESFIPSPSELPGGPITFAFGSALVVFLVVYSWAKWSEAIASRAQGSITDGRAK